MFYKELLKELEVMENNNFTAETLFSQTQRLTKTALTEFLAARHEDTGFLNKTLIELAFSAAKFNNELIRFFDFIELLEKFKFRPEELSPESINKIVKRAKELVYILYNSKIVILRLDKD